jgi:hypothetical protein
MGWRVLGASRRSVDGDGGRARVGQVPLDSGFPNGALGCDVVVVALGWTRAAALRPHVVGRRDQAR